MYKGSVLTSFGATEITVAAMSLGGVLITAVLGYLTSKHQTLRKMAEKEMSLQAVALSFTEYASEWAEIYNQIQALIDETNIDRVMILKAWNGSQTPRWATAVLQIRQAGQEPVTYTHYELDQDYVYRINQITSGSALRFKTADIPESGIKEVYEMEGVKESIWTHIGTRKLNNGKSSLISYVTVSTHSEEGLTLECVVRAKLISDQIKSVYRAFHNADQ